MCHLESFSEKLYLKSTGDLNMPILSESNNLLFNENN